MKDQYWMERALELATKAASENEIPVGAIIVLIIGEGYNAPISLCDPTAHAEIQAIRMACQKMKNYRLPGATLYVTLEPCSMCAGAMIHARIDRVVYAAMEPKSGVVESQGRFFEAPFLNHKVNVESGVLAEKASTQLMQFFRYRREQKKKLKERAKKAI
jgi:tRNA(adenine34) deaminase